MFQAQKPWAKKYSKVIKAKKEYYNACKLDRAAAAQEKTLRGVPDTAADQVVRTARNKKVLSHLYRNY